MGCGNAIKLITASKTSDMPLQRGNAEEMLHWPNEPGQGGRQNRAYQAHQEAG